MSIYLRGKTYWIQFTTPDGQRILRSAGTRDKQEAQELHDTLKAESWRVKQLGERPRFTWQQAAVRWLQESSHKRSLKDDRCHLRWLDPHFGKLKLDEITRDRIDQVRASKLEEGASPARTNRMLALARAILNRAAKEWDWIEAAPHVRMLKEPKMRVRWLKPHEAERLIRELPPHLAEMARFSLLTGLRESNVTRLRWDQLDMARRCAWIHADEAKAGRAIAVPLNDEALQCVRRQMGKHLERVFTYEGRPVARCNNHAWRKALERAGIGDFRWHDLRHTWASWHVQNGTPLHVLRELGGWASMDLVLRYAHLSPGHLGEHAGSVSLTATNLLQSVK